MINNNNICDFKTMDIGVNLPCSNKNSKPLIDDALDIIAHNYALGTLIPLDKDVVDDMICDDKSTRTKYIQTVFRPMSRMDGLIQSLSGASVYCRRGFSFLELSLPQILKSSTMI